VVSALNTPNTGLVTCLYRARAESWATRMEALGIATEFAPSVLVARLVGVVEFALGATMVLRAETLREIGGFEPIAEYLADDYQLGLRVAKCGHRIELTAPVVETSLGAASWRQVWRHQLRWARTVRVSSPGGYYGSLVTHATIWALLSFAAGIWWAGAIALLLRLGAGYVAGAVVLEDPIVKRWFWLMPVRDLFGFGVWLGGCAGTIVHWRDRKLRLERDGRITEIGKG
jgi:ceramide glucosyltransferase